MQHPFNHYIGDNILIRSRVQNFVGWSDFYYTTEIMKVISNPLGRVQLFQNLSSNDFEAIDIFWTELKFPEDGGDTTTGYIVFWGEGSPDSEWKILVKFSSPFFSANTKDYGIKLNPLDTYKFKV